MRSARLVRLTAPALAAALALLLAPPSPGAQAREDVLSTAKPLAGPGQDVLTTLPPEGPKETKGKEEQAPGRAPRAEVPAPPEEGAPGTGIEVLNGSGFGGHATFWSRRLRERGLAIGRVADADRPDHPKTVIYYSDGAENVALEVRRVLGREAQLQPLQKPGRHRVVVILGRDLPRSDAKKPDSR
ncbi:MAG: LytR C-terminal domain-containing protein [Nitrospinota bacterium]